jgi:ABC-type Na+ transport system ATPase subunit NatA|tara:strand:+ start:371 stop:496 length:126 start_codon:yes stop_codon:yes gene_type:complete
MDKKTKNILKRMDELISRYEMEKIKSKKYKLYSQKGKNKAK